MKAALLILLGALAAPLILAVVFGGLALIVGVIFGVAAAVFKLALLAGLIGLGVLLYRKLTAPSNHSAI